MQEHVCHNSNALWLVSQEEKYIKTCQTLPKHGYCHGSKQTMGVAEPGNKPFDVQPLMTGKIISSILAKKRSNIYDKYPMWFGWIKGERMQVPLLVKVKIQLLLASFSELPGRTI